MDDAGILDRIYDASCRTLHQATIRDTSGASTSLLDLPSFDHHAIKGH